MDLALCTVLFFCYRPCPVYSLFLLLKTLNCINTFPSVIDLALCTVLPSVIDLALCTVFPSVIDLALCTVFPSATDPELHTNFYFCYGSYPVYSLVLLRSFSCVLSTSNLYTPCQILCLFSCWFSLKYREPLFLCFALFVSTNES